MTDEQYADLLAFAASRGGEYDPVPVTACLPDFDPPRFLDAHASAPHLGGPKIFVSHRDYRDLNRRVMAESCLTP